MGICLFRRDITGIAGGRSRLRSDTLILLDGKQRTTVRRDGSFTVPNLQQGEYILTVFSKDYLFSEYYLRINAEDQIHISPYNANEKLPTVSSENSLNHPLTVSPLTNQQYVEVKQPFDLKKMVMANPLYLIMGGALLFVIGMPKLLASIDPELLKEVQENQSDLHKRMAKAQNTDLADGISNFLAGGSAPAKDTRKKR